MAKTKTKEERAWMNDVASLGCVCCRNMGYGASPAELHHVRHEKGMAQRANHKDVLPLCPRHHRASYETGFHASKRLWQIQHGSESKLLIQVKQEVVSLRLNTIGGAA